MPSFKNKFPFFSVLLVFMACFLACQQVLTSQEAPQAVQDNFNKMYPGEDNPNWHVDAHGYMKHILRKMALNTVQIIMKMVVGMRQKRV